MPALLAAAGLVLSAPVAGVAAAASLIPATTGFGADYVPFTPARIDPALARRVAATLGLDGLRFTPPPRTPRGERVVTMAVRVDQATARRSPYAARWRRVRSARAGRSPRFR